MAKVVQLKTSAADSGHYRGVRDNLGLDAQFARAEDEVGMRRSSVMRKRDGQRQETRVYNKRSTSVPKGIPNHEESYIHLVRICEDVVATGLDELSVGFNNRTAIECFLLNNWSLANRKIKTMDANRSCCSGPH